MSPTELGYHDYDNSQVNEDDDAIFLEDVKVHHSGTKPHKKAEELNPRATNMINWLDSLW